MGSGIAGHGKPGGSWEENQPVSPGKLLAPPVGYREAPETLQLSSQGPALQVILVSDCANDVGADGPLRSGVSYDSGVCQIAAFGNLRVWLGRQGPGTSSSWCVLTGQHLNAPTINNPIRFDNGQRNGDMGHGLCWRCRIEASEKAV